MCTTFCSLLDLNAWLTSYNASLGSLSYSMFQRPLPSALTDDGTSLTNVTRYPETGSAVVTNVWWTNTNTAVTSIIHFYFHSIYIDDLHRSLSWWQVSYGAASIMRRFRGHTHPVPIRHRFPQLPAANHRAVASRLQPLVSKTKITTKSSPFIDHLLYSGTLEVYLLYVKIGHFCNTLCSILKIYGSSVHDILANIETCD